ncbi:MAG: histidine kinase [Chitinophagaceae bacterium]|nr:histidine kinase [Chitinophagaceae bacterium]
MLQHPFIFSDEPRYRIRRHICFWLAWWLFQAFLYSFIAINRATDYYLRLPVSMLESLIYLSVHIFLAYTLIYFVIPRFLMKQRYWLAGLLIALSFLVAAAMSAVLSIFVINPMREWLMGDQYVGPPRTTWITFFLSLMAGLRGGITIGGMAAAIKLMKTLYLKEQRNLQLQKENVQAQLQLLKAQVHPHFLFNTLNNIYSHTQNTAPVAARMVSGLSAILRFILYESTHGKVPLSKELELLQNYINLENIRYSNKLDLHIDLPENTGNLKIDPLLLLPLVENCFKHGASQMLEQPWISLQITLQDAEMNMKLINGKTAEAVQHHQPSGIGIQNVRKRLELLYSGKHYFSITDDEDVFIVNLKLELEQSVSTQPEPVAIEHV